LHLFEFGLLPKQTTRQEFSALLYLEGDPKKQDEGAGGSELTNGRKLKNGCVSEWVGATKSQSYWDALERM
jgi:hypothetical protein